MVENNPGVIEDLLRTIKGWRQADDDRDSRLLSCYREELAKLHLEESEARQARRELQEMCKELAVAHGQWCRLSGQCETEEVDLEQRSKVHEEEIAMLRSELAQAKSPRQEIAMLPTELAQAKSPQQESAVAG